MAKMKWTRLLVASALAFGTVACGDDDILPFDAGTTDGGPTPDVPSLGDVGPGPDGGPDAGPGPDGGPDGGPDVGPGPDGGPDGGPDAGPMFNPAASAQITLVRDAAEGVQDPALAVEGAFVTYVKPAIGSDPAAFFVQGEPEGPALYVAVDPDTLTPVPVPGDTVTFNVTETETAASGGQHRVLAITDFARSAQGFNTAALVQDLSNVGDVITALDDYESELVMVTGTLTNSFGFAGTDHEAASFMTMMIDDGGLRVRIPTAVIASSGVFEGCTFTAGPAPMWRFNTTAQVSAFSAAEITAVTCPAPTVVSAAAVDEVTVGVTFSSALDAATVIAADFAFTGGITATDAVVAGPDVTLTVTGMVAATEYTVTVTGVTNEFGTDIDVAANTAMFTGVGVDLGELLITEYVEGSSNNKAIEITNVGPGMSNLADCLLARHTNGSMAISATLDLVGTLAAGESVVLCNTSISDMTVCDVLSGVVNHNGNDAFEVICGGTVIDTFGVAAGSDPGNFTGTNGMGQALSGANMTLRRLCTVTGADADIDVTDAFELGTQWDASTPADPTMSQDDFTGLGEHCP